MDAFPHIKNSGKSVTGKFDNVDVVLNSNDKGLQIMRYMYVSDLHVHVYRYTCTAVRPRTREIVSTRLKKAVLVTLRIKLRLFTLLVSSDHLHSLIIQQNM